MAGLVVFWPALSSPMGIDDHLHAAMIEGTYPGHRGAWVADRSVLLSLVFGAEGFAKHVDWRRNERGRDGLRSLFGFTLSMLCGECGLAFLGYVFAIDSGWRALPRLGESREAPSASSAPRA